MNTLLLLCLGFVWAGDDEESSLANRVLPRLYQGRTLEEWIGTANNPNELVRADAIETFLATSAQPREPPLCPSS